MPTKRSGVSSVTDDTAERVSRVAGSISRYLGRIVGDGRSVSAWRVLGTLATSGPRRIGDLATDERIAQPTMTSLISRLEAEGLVRKVPDDHDRRALLAELTERGHEEVLAYRHRAAAALDFAMDGLSAEEFDLLARSAGILEHVAGRLQEHALSEKNYATGK
ncbi:MarR family winged helix-turn-helix transcriptional regulator [Glutamicibacter endophyticus]|uniref:MarR family winged helix-turn-helix transcriptional regulator n=1 Tax=Glutamicibacter endophyticus TaxID=1522174 RepID=UPI003AF0450B